MLTRVGLQSVPRLTSSLYPNWSALMGVMLLSLISDVVVLLTCGTQLPSWASTSLGRPPVRTYYARMACIPHANAVLATY